MIITETHEYRHPGDGGKLLPGGGAAAAVVLSEKKLMLYPCLDR